MQCSDKSQMLNYIISLLDEKRDSFNSGSCRLTLTASLTQELQSAVNYPLSPNPRDRDVSSLLSNVKSLRISSKSDDGLVDLSPFPNLTHLEIVNVPSGNLNHLSKLRSQLNHLVLLSCVQSLGEILIECGGDGCVDSFLWSELHTLVVTGCVEHPLELGSGLQVIPWLKTLNLSSNLLTDNSLVSLTTLLTLKQLVLNFNRLCHVPSLAPSARSSLKVLHLRHNQLDSLKGLEQLSALEELDVAYNCISVREAIQSLSCLPQLVNLCLQFNPISYSKTYRITVLQKVSSAVNKKKFKLDGQPLSSIEKDVMGTLALLSSLQLQYYDSPPSSFTNNEAVVGTGAAAVTANGTGEINQTPNARSTRSGSNSSTKLTTSATRRKATRMREVLILEADVPNYLPSDVPVSVTNEKKEEEQKLLHQQQQQQQQQQQPVGGSINGSLKEEEHLTTKQRLEELRRTFGQENWLHSQAGNQVRQLLGWEEEESEEANRPLLTEEALTSIPLNDSTLNRSTTTSVLGGIEESTHPSEVESIEVLKSEVLLNDVDDAADDDDDDDDGTEVHVYVVQRHVEDVEWERLLTLSGRLLCEKDALSGQTLASWKTSSLKSLNVVDRRDAVRFHLFFLPASQSYRQRDYTMEENDFTEFEKLVQEALASRPVQTGRRKSEVEEVQLRCIKCDHVFTSLSAAVKLRSVSSVALNQVKGQLEEYLVCPFCASELIFPVEQLDDAADGDTDPGIAVVCTEGVGEGGSGGGNEDLETTGGGDSSTNSGVDSEGGSVEVIHDKMPNLTWNCHTSPLKSGASGASGASLLRLADAGSSSQHSGGSSSQNSKRAARSSHDSAAQIIQYSYADFSQVDHRLRLYCEMSLLSHENEEFLGLIKADLLAATSDVEQHPVLLVVTSQKLYFMRITGNQSEQPEKWLSQEASFPLQHLLCILTVIGHQGLVLHLGKDQSTLQLYLLLIRDNRRTRNSLQFLLGALEKCGVATSESDLMSWQWAALDRLVRGKSEPLTGIEAAEAEEASEAHEGGSSMSSSGSSNLVRVGEGGSGGVFLLCVECRLEWKEPQQCNDYGSNVSLMVTCDRIALISGDPRWLLSRQIHFRTWGVALLSLQLVVNLISLESFVNHPEKLRLNFTDEASNLQERWTLSLATRDAVDQLIEAVRHPWEAMFSVELEINELDE